MSHLEPIPRLFFTPTNVLRQLVGSGAGAVIRRKLLGRIRRFRLRARLGASVIPFPAPATSHAAGRFPALRAPAHFTARFMRPKAGPSSGGIVRASGPADGWVLLSIHPCLPYRLRHRVQQGPFALRTLLRFNAVGSEVARLGAGHRPPLKLYVRISRIQLSRRLTLRE